MIFKNLKALTPIISVTLLILFGVISFTYLQNWFVGYNSNFQVGLESSFDKSSIEINYLYSDNLFINNKKDFNVFLDMVKIDGKNCFINSTLIPGFNEIDIGDCTYSMDVGYVDVLVEVNNKIFSKKIPLKKVYTYPVPRDNLIAEYLFENYTNLGLDTSGNNYHGTFNGISLISYGKIGNSIRFDGVDDYINIVGFSSALNNQNEMSISSWVNIADLSSKVYPSIIDVFSGDGAYRQFIFNFNGNKPEFIIENVSDLSSSYTYSENLTIGIWNHLLFSYNGSVVNFYWNNVFVGYINHTGQIRNVTRDGHIGWYDRLVDPGPQNFFEGEMDNLRIYNRSLNETEIKYLFEES